MHHALIEHIQSQTETVASLQEALVARPALGPENGGQGEAAKSRFLHDELIRLGFPDVRELPCPDHRVESGQRPNLAAFVPGQAPQGRLWIVSHMDVVPPGDASLWQTDPYVLHRQGDRLVGRGVEDNHHGLVASILAAQAFLATGQTPWHPLGLLFVADEETGNACGIDFLLNTHPELFQPEDVFLVPDFGRADSGMIEVAEKGLLWLKLTVNGRQCHASTPHKGINSLRVAAELITRVGSLYELFPQENALFDPQGSTFEPTKKEANVPNVNTLPGQDIFSMDCRILPDCSMDEVLDSVRSLCREVESSTGATIELEVIHRTPPSSTNPDHPFLARLSRCIETVYTVKPELRGIGGGTVASFPRRKGFPAAVWSTLAGNAHQPNEYTSIQNIIDDAKVMALLCLHDSMPFCDS
jgi:succinyl-diaminopimelate desuccinylase